MPCKPWPITFEHYKTVWNGAGFAVFFKNSVIIALFTLFGTTVLSLLGGYALERFRFRGRGAFMVMTLCTQFIPGAMMLIPLAAHALFARPLVLGRSSEAAIEMTLDNREDGILTLDGRRTADITAGMRIEARLSATSVRLARLAPTPFADRLVEKFQLPVVGWRERGPRTR